MLISSSGDNMKKYLRPYWLLDGILEEYNAVTRGTLRYIWRLKISLTLLTSGLFQMLTRIALLYIIHI